MQRTSNAVDGFHLAYERAGDGAPVLLLHGWPGASSDYREVAQRLDADVIRPDLVRALVLSPPMPGVGRRVLEPGPQAAFWYQHFHRLDLSERLIDGDSAAVRAYLEHFWDGWSAPGWTPPADVLDHLTALYSRPGAFVASIQWYRAGAGTVARALQEQPPAERIATPTTVLWPGHDPLFPPEWSDRLGEFFADVDLRQLPDSGHFSPLEAPDEVAAAIRERLS